MYFGSILAGVLLYDHFVDNAKQPTKEDSEQQTEKNVSTGIYHIRSGDGELDLPPCRLMAVELIIAPSFSFIARWVKKVT